MLFQHTGTYLHAIVPRFGLAFMKSGPHATIVRNPHWIYLSGLKHGACTCIDGQSWPQDVGPMTRSTRLPLKAAGASWWLIGFSVAAGAWTLEAYGKGAKYPHGSVFAQVQSSFKPEYNMLKYSTYAILRLHCI